MVKQVSDRVAVMYLGQLAEIGPSEGIYRQPLHPYTAALLDSIPRVDPVTGKAHRPVALPGEPPSPIEPPSGCRFRTRCPRAQLKCAEEVPLLAERLPGHQVACHFPLDLPMPEVPRMTGGASLPGEAPEAKSPVAESSGSTATKSL
jgi:oligopeptide transport system ATP-binding protein